MLNNENFDETVLKILGDQSFGNGDDFQEKKKAYIRKTSNAIMVVIEKHGVARLRTVGASSLANAMKAAINAREYGMKSGMDLVIEPSYSEAMFDNGSRSAVVLKVFSISAK